MIGRIRTAADENTVEEVQSDNEQGSQVSSGEHLGPSPNNSEAGDTSVNSTPCTAPTNEKYDTIHEAAKDVNERAVQTPLIDGCGIDARDGIKGQTALHAAAELQKQVMSQQ